MQVILNYSYLTRTGPSNMTVLIPVPLSKIDAAKKAVEKLAEII